MKTGYDISIDANKANVPNFRRVATRSCYWCDFFGPMDDGEYGCTKHNVSFGSDVDQAAAWGAEYVCDDWQYTEADFEVSK